MTNTISHDKSIIKNIYDSGSIGFEVGLACNGLQVTKIVTYDEYGPMSLVPFYAIYHEEEIIARVPGYMVVVEYELNDPS